ncbi:MAG: alpha-L-fucosidase [Fimbriimonadaceae bacterium]|nr:alpha-L-fucosidase [Fimbriimonadaceae bacterium]
MISTLLLTAALLGPSHESRMTEQNIVPKPHPRQLAWHAMRYYAFIHFGPNTFTNREWGEGREDPTVFAPTALDCRQWCRTIRDAGMTGVILTAKHHDGFCLWPSKLSTHTVRESGLSRDILRELSDACREYGLKLGIYLSPWDRNHPAYGSDAYNDVFVGMLREVLTDYGDIFEVWFDGANGEGPNGKRQEYDWKRYVQTVRDLQPNAVIFSDAGPDIRWVGNEQGIAAETHWYGLDRDRYVPGTPHYRELAEGQRFGTHYVPAECDVSIRPGWFYHPEQDDQVKSPGTLFDLYEKSVGRGANLLLNLPVDRRGLIPERDAGVLREVAAMVRDTYGTNGAPIGDRLVLQEDLKDGQRVASVRVTHAGQTIAEATSVGAQRYLAIPAVEATSLRIEVQPESARKSVRHHVAQSPDYRRQERLKWWKEARFGMFIHWGLYAIPAGEWKGKRYGGASEWLINNAKIPTKEWNPLLQQFNPVKYDPKQWVAIAKAAGMKYIVLTSKHHEGFALWPSEYGDFHVGLSPYRRDLIGPLMRECKRAGIKLGLYHSIMDWHHPDYLPRRDWDKRSDVAANWERYKQFLRNQLHELMTKYPDTAVLWFDGEWEDTWTHEDGVKLYDELRAKYPKLIINNRVDKGRAGMEGLTRTGDYRGDFGTPEQEIPAKGLPGVDWESCMTMNDSWGFHRTDTNWKSARTMLQNLIDIASKGGNYLLNVGPTAEGEIPAASEARLREMGSWLAKHGRAVYGTEPSPISRTPAWGRFTRRGSTLYAHVFEDSLTELDLSAIDTNITKVTDFAGKPLVFQNQQVALPRQPGIRVIQIETKGPIRERIIRPTLARERLDLRAQTADASHGIRYESDKQALGFWTNANAEVRWEVQAEVRASYQVELEFACDPTMAQSTVEVLVGGESQTWTVPATGGWSNFRTVTLSPVQIVAPGPTEVRIRVKSMPNGAVMNLRRLSLVPADCRD